MSESLIASATNETVTWAADESGASSTAWRAAAIASSNWLRMADDLGEHHVAVGRVDVDHNGVVRRFVGFPEELRARQV